MPHETSRQTSRDGFPCRPWQLLKGIFFRGIIKKMGHGLFGGLKNIEVIISK
jgi:hypothetical protein